MTNHGIMFSGEFGKRATIAGYSGDDEFAV